MQNNYIPRLDTAAGACLTSANWQEIGTTTASYALESLLVKPGPAEQLSQIKDLKTYLAWPNHLILNAMNLPAANKGVYKIISHYDGSRVEITAAELVGIINNLKPDALVLPRNIIQEYPEIWDNWDEAILPFISVDDMHQLTADIKHGIYFRLEENAAKITHFTNTPRLLAGDIAPDLIKQLSDHHLTYIETDQPARLAMQGIVYSKTGNLDLTDPQFQQQFDVIESTCSCPTCSQQLSKAYLHHLIQHTPLLCQRFLIQHNAYFSFTF